MNGSIEQIAIIGAGKVGTAMAYLLQKAGYGVAGVSDRNPSALVDILSYTSAQPCSSPEEAARKADFILITTPDDEIAGTCRTLSDSGAILPGNKVVHMSGAGGLDLLESARRSGALVASIHPIQSFADIGGAIENLPGSAFGDVMSNPLVLPDCGRPIANNNAPSLEGVIRQTRSPLSLVVGSESNETGVTVPVAALSNTGVPSGGLMVATAPVRLEPNT